MQMDSPNEKAVQAIVYGHSCAMRLKRRLENPMADDGLISSYDLAQSIVSCFSNAISILSNTPKSEDDQSSDLSSRVSPPPPPPTTPLPQKTNSKKRKLNITNSSESWRDDSPDPIYYDGFLWRKYGQKSIKKSNHQRSYYRCSYNIDHHCQARKHEQKIKDNPPVYRTTYFGQHTCKMSHKQDAVYTTVQDPVDDLDSTVGMIRFGEDHHQEKDNYSRSFALSVKQEDGFVKQETMDQDHCQQVIEENQSSPSGSYPPPSSSGSESAEFDSDSLIDNLDSWDRFDQLFDFGLG